MSARPEPHYTALRDYHRCIEGMLADPQLGGDLLLVGLYLARRAHLGQRFVGEEAMTGTNSAKAIFGDTGDPASNAHRLRKTMVGDIRRYDSHAAPRNQQQPTDGFYRKVCGGPTIRRDTPCGKRAVSWWMLTYIDTGGRYPLAACERHLSWGFEEVAANQAAVEALGDRLPAPPGNVGGVLARHIPGFDWHGYWQKLDPRWTAPPEVSPAGKPKLALIISDDFDPAEDPTAAPARPALSLVPST